MKHVSCVCDHCQNLCRIFPGWMTPRDLVRLGGHLDVPVPSLFTTHLAVDRFFGNPLREDDVPWIEILIPVPASGRTPPGHLVRRPLLSSNEEMVTTCALLDNGLCSIHEVKPRECRESYGTQCQYFDLNELDGVKTHRRIPRMWARPGVQEWLQGHLSAAHIELREPVAETPMQEVDDAFNGLMSRLIQLVSREEKS